MNDETPLIKPAYRNLYKILTTLLDNLENQEFWVNADEILKRHLWIDQMKDNDFLDAFQELLLTIWQKPYEFAVQLTDTMSEKEKLSMFRKKAVYLRKAWWSKCSKEQRKEIIQQIRAMRYKEQFLGLSAKEEKYLLDLVDRRKRM